MPELSPDGSADVVLLAGGAGRRFAAQRPGVDKLTVQLCDTTLIGRLVADLQPRWRILLVGHPLAAATAPGRVVQLREDPPGGGPLPALAAGLERSGAPAVVVLGGDQPFAASAVPRLLAALAAEPGALAAVGVDPTGRRQPLLSALRRERALRAVRELAAAGGLAGRPLRALLTPGAHGGLVEVPVSGRECLDVDVPADLERARALLAGAPEQPGT
ncbi:molybdenum cofactor guanylyltransferase [Kineococcus arenarius]|uniref:molybdenum cofactor guanylyltransferase n=1 Tax=Kineococcus sp. SYSU DK007 TaxID=3383128 RepID=UPI003D7C6B2D